MIAMFIKKTIKPVFGLKVIELSDFIAASFAVA